MGNRPVARTPSFLIKHNGFDYFLENAILCFVAVHAQRYLAHELYFPSWHCCEWYNSPVKNETWQEALLRTRETAFGRLAALLGATELSSDYWDELEAMMVQADIGILITQKIITELQARSRDGGLTRGDQVRTHLKDIMMALLIPPEKALDDVQTKVIVMVGVNGSGKTTTVARLAALYKKEGKQCLIAAADTFRAAATEQLEYWANLLGIEIIKGQRGSDPGAVVYSATQAALARNIDVLIVDTSGRMHTQHNLMDELKKVCSVSTKLIPEAPHQVLLVLDATTGQNGISQAKSFADAVAVSGVVLAKLDSSGKGGVGFEVASELKLPILYAGVGEELDDLIEFDPAAFVASILSPIR